MNRNTLWIACGVVVLALAGFSCDPEIEPCPEGEYDCHGECIPDGEECLDPCPEETPHRCPDGTCVADESECDTEHGCRADDTCDPNYYEDPDLGSYPTDSYGLRQVRVGTSIRARRSGHDIAAINAWAEDSQVHYWLLTEVYEHGGNEADVRAVNVFQDGVIVHRLFEFVRPDGSIILEQNPIIESTADMADYSPLVQIWFVHVPDGYIPNTIKSLDSIDAAAIDEEFTGIWVEPTPAVIVLDVTDPSIGLESIGDIQQDWRPEQISVWYDSREASAWMHFLTPHEDGISIFVADPPQGDWSHMPEPLPAEVWQPQACAGRNIYLEMNKPGRTLYSPVVTRMYFDPGFGPSPTTAQCQSLPTNAQDLYDALDDGTYSYSTWAEIVMVTAQFPY